MASVTGNMAKEYWDDFGIIGPRSQLLKHRHCTQNPPRLGYQSVSDTWGLAKVVRKVEFKLQLRRPERTYSSSACLMELKADIVIGALNDAMWCELPL